MAEVKKFGNPKNIVEPNIAEEVLVVGEQETPEELVTNIDAPVIKKVTGCGALNIRSEASTNSEILGTVLVNTNVTVDSEVGEWSHIEHETIKGFCMSQYLKDL